MVGCLYVCLCLNTGVVSEQCVVTRVEKEVLDVVPLGLRAFTTLEAGELVIWPMQAVWVSETRPLGGS